MADCEESMKKELKDFDRAAKSEVGGRGKESRYERRKGNRESKWLILGVNYILCLATQEAVMVVEYNT